nr:hypothetical protein PHYPA_012418 [Physcomitrium patens]
MSTPNLASMRIGIAGLQLKELRRAHIGLEQHCRLQVEAMQGALRDSSKKVFDDPNGARRELVRVQKLVQTCNLNLTAIGQHLQSHDLLAKVGQSVASAESLIDQSEITGPLPSPQVESVNDEASESVFETEGSAPSTLSSRVSEDRNSRQTGLTPSINNLGPFPVPPKFEMSMSELVVDFCSNHVIRTLSTAIIRLDRSCGGKFHTTAKYTSGVFTIRMRAPANAPGMINSFYISSNDGALDMISFDFVGNQPNRVLTAYAVNGNHEQKLKTFHMDFDTTAEFHQYTIKWDNEMIVWMVDDVVLRTLRASCVKDYPTKPGHIFGYSWDASSLNDGAMAGRMNWLNAPYFMHFKNLQVTSPLRRGDWVPPQQKNVQRTSTNSIRPFVIDYCPWSVAADAEHDVDITFDKKGCGGRLRSLNSYPSGKFSSRIKCAEGDTSGLLTSFYVSSGEGTITQDEIDFEFLGDNKRIVQTNFYVNGTSDNEQWVELDYDCSSGFHTYAIHYDQHQIKWFVDSKLVRTVVKEDQLRERLPYPTKRMFLYSSVWNASFVNDGGWTGKWHGMGELPFVARFKDVVAQYFSNE